MKRFLHLITFLLLASVLSIAYAQESRSISGTVRDQSRPLIGVSVLLKGTDFRTSTGATGEYLIQASRGDTLLFNNIGYESAEIVVGQSAVIDVILKESSASLDEVVVVGYGTQSRRNITGSVSSVDMSETENLPNTNITQALRGRVAGVQFTDDGRPGQGGGIIIRGPQSLNASNSPLIVLDGIFFEGSLRDINPNDIESMEILKDASASAIYGSRAANGVILITSKKGTTEKPTIRFNSFYGFLDWTNRLPLLSPEGYIQKTLDVRKQRGLPHDPSQIELYLTPSEADNYLAGNVVVPHDEVAQSGRLFSSDVSISGATKMTNYYLSASLTNDQGLIYGDKENKRTFRVNMENHITDWLTIGTNSMLSLRDQSGVPASFGASLDRQSPFSTWYHDDGEPMQFTVPEDAGISSNPMRNAILGQNSFLDNNLFSNFYGILKIPGIEGLQYRVNYSNSYRWLRDYQFQRQDIHLEANNTSASKRNRNATDWVVENILSYNFKLGQDHDFDLTALYGLKGNSFETTTASNVQFATDFLGWNDLGLGTLPYVFSGAEETREISSMARLNYRFKDRYLFTLTARRDGSSVFAAQNKYATFPSAAFAWIASDESFLNDISYLDMLKIRLSYGAVGNQAIGPYQSLSLAGTNRYVYGDGSDTFIGLYPSNIASENLKWETTYTTNLAVDFGLFENRVSGTFEWYNLDTRDLLVQRTLPSMTGFSSIWTNLGQVNNRGIEVSLNTVNVKNEKFEWSTNFVFSHNKNKIVSLYGIDSDGSGKEDDDIGNSWFIGQPINVYYDFVFDGIYQQGDALPPGYEPGFPRFKDLDEDGRVEAQNDRDIIGQSVYPRYRWGITNTFTYGNLQLSVFVNAMQGWIGSFNQMDNFYTGDPLRPVNMLDLGYWTPENQSETRPSLNYNRSTLGHNWYLSRNFIRVQDVTLAYTFPNMVLDKYKLSNLTVFFGGKNLYTFTDWLGTNPETITSYPLPRSYSLGMRIGF